MTKWWLRLARYARPQGRGLSLVALLMLAGTALNILKPWPMKLLVDYVLTGKPLPPEAAWISHLPGANSSVALLAWLAGATVLLFLAAHSMGTVQGYVQAGVGSWMTYDLGRDLFDRLQRLSLRFHGRQPVGDLVRRVTADSGCVQGLVMGVLIPVLTSVLSLAAMFVVMWRLDSSLSLVALVTVPFLFLLIRVLDRPMTERSYQQQQREGEMMALAEQTFTALPVVQAFGREEHEDRRFRTLSQHTIRAYMRAIAAQLQFRVGVSAVTAAGTSVVIIVGGMHVLQGSLTVGSLLVFLSYLSSLYGPLEGLAYTSAGFASAAAGARRVFEVLDAEDGVRDAPGARVLPSPVRGHVRLEGVSFGYEPDSLVLQDVSLEARPGETVALVGATGAGKSTLASLIPRFFDPLQGRVTFDGIDIREVQLQSLRAEISLVLQEPFLLPLSVAENIAYGRPEASREEIQAAARAASADEFIRRLPQGYDTVIGERGATLSGGQRQRLAIARALLKDAPVLILDEPTSALDARTEALLLDALERLMKGRTTFVIAHRLSTIRRADRIVVLEHGRVLETGSHTELLTRGGAYSHFWYAQFADSPSGAAA